MRRNFNTIIGFGSAYYNGDFTNTSVSTPMDKLSTSVDHRIEEIKSQVEQWLPRELHPQYRRMLMQDAPLRPSDGKIADQLRQALVETAKQLEKLLNRHGMSIYSYGLWKSYISCLFSLGDRETGQNNFANEVLRKVCNFVPLKNNDLCREYQSLQPNKAQIPQHTQDIFVDYVSRFEQYSRPGSFDIHKLLLLELQLQQVENIPSRYCATRLQWVLELALEVEGGPYMGLFGCLKLLSYNYLPYTDFVLEFFQKNAAVVFERAPVQAQPADRLELALGLLHRYIQHGEVVQLAMAEILRMLQRRDLQQILEAKMFQAIKSRPGEHSQQTLEDVVLYLLINALQQPTTGQAEYLVNFIAQIPQLDTVEFARRVANSLAVNQLTVPGYLLQYLLRFRTSQLILDLDFCLRSESAQVSQVMKELSAYQQTILKAMYDAIYATGDAEVAPRLHDFVSSSEGLKRLSALEFLLIRFDALVQNDTPIYRLVQGAVPFGEVLSENLAGALSEDFDVSDLFSPQRCFGISLENRQQWADSKVLKCAHQAHSSAQLFVADIMQQATQKQATKDSDMYPPTTPPAIRNFLEKTRGSWGSEPAERNAWKKKAADAISEIAERVLRHNPWALE